MYNFVDHQERRKREAEAAMAQVAAKEAAEAAAEQQAKAKQTAEALESLAASTIESSKLINADPPPPDLSMASAAPQSVNTDPSAASDQSSISNSAQITNPT